MLEEEHNTLWCVASVVGDVRPRPTSSFGHVNVNEARREERSTLGRERRIGGLSKSWRRTNERRGRTMTMMIEALAGLLGVCYSYSYAICWQVLGCLTRGVDDIITIVIVVCGTQSVVEAHGKQPSLRSRVHLNSLARRVKSGVLLPCTRICPISPHPPRIRPHLQHPRISYPQ